MSAPPNAAAYLRLLSAMIGDSGVVTESRDCSSNAYLPCSRGLHPMTPENTSQAGHGRRCRACKIEYNRTRRAGKAWERAERAARAPYDRPMPESQLRRLRELVGACVECGWTLDAGIHLCGPSVTSADRAEAG